MRIVWDEPKRRMNLIKHRLDFAELTVDFFQTAYIEESKNDRFKAIGEFKGQLVIVVVFRPLGSEAISLISMRPASRRERNL
jgi:uncharacterized protein